MEYYSAVDVNNMIVIFARYVVQLILMKVMMIILMPRTIFIVL